MVFFNVYYAGKAVVHLVAFPQIEIIHASERQSPYSRRGKVKEYNRLFLKVI